MYNDSIGIYMEELTEGNSLRKCQVGTKIYKKHQKQKEKQNDSFVRHELVMSTKKMGNLWVMILSRETGRKTP